MWGNASRNGDAECSAPRLPAYGLEAPWGKIAFFVDEDEARIGRDYFGIPIIAPSQVPLGATVFVCLEPNLAQAIAARHAERTRKYIATTALP